MDKNEKIIFSLWNDRNITTCRLIATEAEIIQQLFDSDGRHPAQVIFTKEQAIYLAKTILQEYGENFNAEARSYE